MIIALTYFFEKKLKMTRIQNNPFTAAQSIDLYFASINDHLLNFLEGILTQYPAMNIRIISSLNLKDALPQLEHLMEKHSITIASPKDKTTPYETALLLYSWKADQHSANLKEAKKEFLKVNSKQKLILNGDGNIYSGNFLNRAYRTVIQKLITHLSPVRDRKESSFIISNFVDEPYDANSKEIRLLTKHPFRIEQRLSDGTAVRILNDEEQSKEIYEEGYHFQKFSDSRPDWKNLMKDFQKNRLRNMKKVGLPEMSSFGEKPTAIDIGCGTGTLAALLHELGFATTAVDHSEHIVASVKEKLPYINAQTLDVKDLSRLNLKYNLITITHVLEHIQDDLNFLKCVKQLMTSESLLYIEVPLFSKQALELRPFWHRQEDHIRDYTKQGLSDLLIKAGCRIIKHSDSLYDEGNEPYQFLMAKL